VSKRQERRRRPYKADRLGVPGADITPKPWVEKAPGPPVAGRRPGYGGRMPSDPDYLMTFDEVAAALRLTAGDVSRLMRNGNLTAVKRFGVRKIRRGTVLRHRLANPPKTEGEEY
jgi:hypothetical protein